LRDNSPPIGGRNGSKKEVVSSSEICCALLAIKGETSINEICTRYQVAPCQVHAWKKQVLDEGRASIGK